MSVKIDLSKKQQPKNYISIRVHIVEVKKTWRGLKDNILTWNVCVPDSRNDAVSLYKAIDALFKEYGLKHGSGVYEV